MASLLSFLLSIFPPVFCKEERCPLSSYLSSYLLEEASSIQPVEPQEVMSFLLSLFPRVKIELERMRRKTSFLLGFSRGEEERGKMAKKCGKPPFMAGAGDRVYRNLNNAQFLTISGE